jgi:hypothetical protein
MVFLLQTSLSFGYNDMTNIEAIANTSVYARFLSGGPFDDGFLRFAGLVGAFLNVNGWWFR